MTSSYASSITILGSARAEDQALLATRVFRLRKSLAAVHFEQPGRGRIKFLPKGAKLSVIGSSACLSEGIEVMYEKQVYNVFIADLLGPWSTPIDSSFDRAQGDRDLAGQLAVPACA